jgi:hypothetical protein
MVAHGAHRRDVGEHPLGTVRLDQRQGRLG